MTRRVYGEAKTPYQRVMESETVPSDSKEKLKALHKTLDPIELRQRLDAKLRRFWPSLKAFRAEAKSLEVTECVA